MKILALSTACFCLLGLVFIVEAKEVAYQEYYIEQPYYFYIQEPATPRIKPEAPQIIPNPRSNLGIEAPVSPPTPRQTPIKPAPPFERPTSPPPRSIEVPVLPPPRQTPIKPVRPIERPNITPPTPNIPVIPQIKPEAPQIIPGPERPNLGPDVPVFQTPRQIERPNITPTIPNIPVTPQIKPEAPQIIPRPKPNLEPDSPIPGPRRPNLGPDVPIPSPRTQPLPPQESPFPPYPGFEVNPEPEGKG